DAVADRRYGWLEHHCDRGEPTNGRGNGGGRDVVGRASTRFRAGRAVWRRTGDDRDRPGRRGGPGGNRLGRDVDLDRYRLAGGQRDTRQRSGWRVGDTRRTVMVNRTIIRGDDYV